MNRKSLITGGMLVLVAGAFTAHAPARAQAQSAGATSAAGERRGPPAEAIAACKSLKLDQTCSFTSPRGAETGTCFQPDTSHPLACRPDHNRGSPDGAGKAPAANAPSGKSGDKSLAEHSHPPAEALAACKSRKLDDACAFTGPRGAMTGTCFQPDASRPLACRPLRK